MPRLVQAPIQPQCSYQYPIGRRSRWNNMARCKHSMCQSTFNFFYSLVILRHNFTGNGKVNCILHVATISDWFPNKRFKNKSCAVVFSSYWTKEEMPAGNQFWKFSRQYSILVTMATSPALLSQPFCPGL